MKSYRLILTMLLLVICRNLYSQVPTYALDVKDDTLIAPNIFEFDIDMIWTNSDSISVFEFAGHKYFFNVNPALGSNGGTVTMSNAGSDLPTNMQPRNPTVYTASNPWQLRWGVNTFPGAGSGFLIPPNATVKMVRVRLQTSALKFPEVPLQLVWRNSLPNPFTKLFAYVGTTNTEITTPNTHFNSLSNYQFPGGLILNVRIGLEGYYRTILDRHIKRDSVTIILRSAAFPFSVLDSSKSVIDSVSLWTQVLFQGIPTGNYYIVIRHRNSIETWSKPGGEPINIGTPYYYDFTSSQGQAYGNNLKLVGTKWCIYTGDVTQSGFIDALDMMNVDNDIFVFRTGYVPTDLNGDNFVDIDDLGMIDNNVRRWIGVERP